MTVDLIALAAPAGFGLACWYLNISYRISIVAGLVLLAVAALLVITGQPGVGNFLGTVVYFFLFVGVALAVIESRRASMHKDETPSHEAHAEPKGNPPFSFHDFLRADHARKPPMR